MTNDPKSKLSHQFGAITGPSESELTDIESNPASEAGAYYTPERIAETRQAFSTDPNYHAVVAARNRTRISGAGDFGISRNEEKAAHASLDAENWTSAEMAGGGKNTSNVTDFDPADFRPAIRGAAVGADVESGPRASSFDRNLPRSSDEARARAQGIMLLKVAGPTCNHPTCQGYRAKGMELLGRALGSSRAITEPWKAEHPEQAIPSVRKDVPVPRMTVRPESRGKEKLVGSYGTKQATDTGDFEINYKDTVMTPKYEAVDTKHPSYLALINEHRQLVKEGESPIFHPDDYLAHHHGAEETNYKLPWE